MTNFLDRPTYLSMRSRLLAERGYIEQEIQRLREEVDYLWRLGEPHEDVKRQLFDTYDAKHQNGAKLQKLDAEWREADEAASLADAKATLPDRKERSERIERALEERTQIIGEIDRRIGELGSLVERYDDLSVSIRTEVKPLHRQLGDAYVTVNLALNSRDDEAKAISALLFDAGVWGAGSRQDSFAFRDAGLSALARRAELGVLLPIKEVLFNGEEVEA